ncbi:hypothetical protein TNCV_1732501 [Trichonephila clavipes]|nr:hypothetical protein TNCV_1732501 [Trichonephila clavipes]
MTYWTKKFWDLAAANTSWNRWSGLIRTVISIDTESGFIAEDHTPPVGHSPAYPILRMVSLDTTGYLEGGKRCQSDSSVVVNEEETVLMTA